MHDKELTVSIVIPAHNEERLLGQCLEAISRQTVVPYEVIVINNNSTDKTVDIALNYDFVTLVNEPRKGLPYVRDTGFNYATGDIIGRIDADTIISDNWVETICNIYQDSDVSAITGSIHYYDAPLSSIIDRADLVCRKWLYFSQHRYPYLFGSNMALRRSSWQTVQHEVCQSNNIHEDLDLAIHLSKHDMSLGFITELKAGVSGRCIDVSPLDFIRYVSANLNSYKSHGALNRLSLYPVVGLVLACYLPLRLLYRSFDDKSRKISPILLLKEHRPARRNPVLSIQ